MKSLLLQFVESRISLVDRLLYTITDYDIYCELTGQDIEIGSAIQSPLRDDDERASFSLFIPRMLDTTRPEEVWWRDFKGDSGDVFKFIKKYAYHKYGEELTNRNSIIKWLDKELSLGIFDEEKVDRQRRVVDYEALKVKKVIYYTSRPFTKRDLGWWLKFGIDEELLKLYRVKSLKYLLNDDFSIKYTFRQTQLAFAFEVYDEVKIYCPDETDFKWRNTCPADYILGAEQLTGLSDTLIITKSLKDIMSFKSLMNVDVISPQSEGHIFTQQEISFIKNKYSKLFVVMDYDDAGINAANRLAEHGFIIKYIDTNLVKLNEKLKVRDKDLSDFIKHHSFKAALSMLRDLFSELDYSYFRVDRVKYLESLMDKFIL